MDVEPTEKDLELMKELDATLPEKGDKKDDDDADVSILFEVNVSKFVKQLLFVLSVFC